MKPILVKQSEDNLQKAAVKIDIRPLSVNEAWKGRRFKTQAYKNYEKALLFLLPRNLVIPDGALKIEYEFGMSNVASDLDNPVKCFTDVLQKKYGFNDSRITEATIKKIKVNKGSEYIEFKITEAV